MSSLIVKVTTIDEIKRHPGADRLEIAIVGGWQMVIPKGEYKQGDKIVYFPPDVVLPPEVSDRFGVTQYLSKGRVRCAKLRGEPSFGLVVTPDEDWPLDTDVAEHYGATKYEPPQKIGAGDADREHFGFPTFTDIENLRHFPDLFELGELVNVSEKIHGTNCRVGLIEGQRMAGSHRVRRKEPEDYKHSIYWLPWLNEGVRACLEDLGKIYQQVIIYGEIYGPGIQNLHYDAKKPQFRVFDMKVGGRFLSPERLAGMAQQYGFILVPQIGIVSYSLEGIKILASGKSTLADHVREGVVVRPLEERDNPKVGRVIAKYVSDEYLLNQDKYSDYTDLVKNG